MAISIQPRTRPAVLSTRGAVIVIAVACALVVNLVIYGLGRAAGGTFTYIQSGSPSTVDAVAVTIMSVGPLATALVLVAFLSRRWRRLVAAARIVGPVLALATIGLMTVPADFDTTSTLFLAAMHVAIIPTMVLALTGLARRR